MKTRGPVYVAIVVIGIVAVCTASFRREHVLSHDGLVGLKATRHTDVVFVSGSILPSGARIEKITTTRSDGDVLIRVYTARIDAGESQHSSGRFNVSVHVGGGIRSIRIGESSNVITLGRMFGIPVRVPRASRTPSTERVLWTLSS